MTSPVLPAISNQPVMDATRVRTFRDRYVAWQARDLPARVADALANAGIDTVGQARLGRASFKGRSNLGPKTLRELVDRPKERLTAADVIAGALSLSLPPDERARDCGGRRHRAAPKRLPAVRLQPVQVR